MNDRRDDGIRLWKAWSQASGLNNPDNFGDIVFSSQMIRNCGDADKDKDDDVEIDELIDYINSWKDGDVGISELMDAIGKWKDGC